jgi:hypothetical protein
VEETIKENITTVHADLQKLARRFFCPEFIHPKEAAAPREGTGVSGSGGRNSSPPVTTASPHLTTRSRKRHTCQVE